MDDTLRTIFENIKSENPNMSLDELKYYKRNVRPDLKNM